jgi:hypothetical protein
VADLHVEEFYKDLAKIVSRLYAAFPRKSTVFVEDIIGTDVPDEFGMHSDRHLACFAAMLWLADEGYLRFEASIRQEAIDQVVLTARCFNALSAQAPGSVEDDPTLPGSVRLEHGTTIHRLREALRAQSSALLQPIVTALMSRMDK